MNLVVDALLAFGVLIAWLTTLAFLRMRSNLDRLHAITFFNLVGGGAITAAAVLGSGFTPRGLQSVLVWLVMVAAGGLLSHAIARALHLRREGRE